MPDHLQSTDFGRSLDLLQSAFDQSCNTNDSQPEKPGFLDLLSGPRFPLSIAFQWAGWNVLQPIDYEISSEFDVTSPRVQQAIAESLPKVHVVSCALDCSTKSRIREIPLPGPQPAPRPLRTLAHPRGAPGLPQHLHDRVRRDNLCADFLLAVQYLMVDKGRGAFRENPRNSLHWADPCEEFLCSSHQWFDWKYDACCLFATRRKKQLIRSSLDTFASLPDLVCGHVHSATEWQPQLLEDGSRWFPSKEEAEYTAHLCFVLVVACSHWAAQRGFAVLRIQRMPPMQTTGDWRHLLNLDPRVFREWALPAVAAFLGLSISDDGPIRVHASDVWTKQDGLAPDAIYIGHGHFSHRLAATDWECPFRVGRDGSPHEVVLQYLQHLNEHVTADQIASLAHLRLACDCPPAEFCHGDALVGYYHSLHSPSVRSPRVGRVGRLLLGVMVGLRIPGVVSQPVSQACLVRSIENLFPSVCWDGCRWPLLEDLANSHPLQAFAQWSVQQPFQLDGEAGPQILSRFGVITQRAGLHEQSGAAAHRSALPILVPFGVDPDGHFRCALDLQCHGTPLESPGPLDSDLKFAAHCMASGPSSIQSARGAALRVLEELSFRLEPISQFLRNQQPVDVQKANRRVHLALIALLIVLMSWPDTGLIASLMQGSPAVGYLPPCGLWAPKQVPFQSLEDALSDGFRDAHELMFQMRPSEHDEASREAGEKDEACGFCTPEFGWDELLAERRSFRLIRRFVIEQSSGKKRVIDDAASGLQSHFSSDGNQLRFCSALQPCLHLQCLYGAMASPTQDWPDDLVSFGEDLPQAYRKIPLAPDHSWACIVAYYSPEKQAVRFRRYHGLLFGLPLAVTCFNRLSFFLQSMIRRILMALGSFYFDDLSVQDWCSSASHCQACVQRLCEHLGYPFASEKQQLPSSSADFLGLVHDLSKVRSTASVSLWIRDRLISKIDGMLTAAEKTHTLTPGQASKLYGCLTFLDQGAFGRIARAGLNALKERQYESQTHITDSLAKVFELVRAILSFHPRRVVNLHSNHMRRVVVASDASQDAPRQGKAGLLLSTHELSRVGAVIHIDSSVFALWDASDTKIAQLELLAVVQGLIAFSDFFRNAHVVWFVDNVAALMALIKGRSDHEELDHMAQIAHSLLFHLHCFAFFEWVPSSSNWSDGISRDGFRDPWLRRFSTHLSSIPTCLWTLPFPVLFHVLSFF